jgi:hypothetical protein
MARHLLSGWTFAAILTAQSGQPYSAYVSADVNNDGNNRNDIAPALPATSSRCRSRCLRSANRARHPLGGTAKVQLIWEAFNLLNADNINGVRTGLYSATGTTLTKVTNFQEPILSAGPRIMQLAVKLCLVQGWGRSSGACGF